MGSHSTVRSTLFDEMTAIDHVDPPVGTARDALSQPAFRRIYIASGLSNTGRWMQQAALGVLAWELTESPAFLGYIIFAQLGPLALLSLPGGSLADTVDRRRLLLATQTWQMIWSFVLAWQVWDGEISETGLLALVFVIGLGQGLFAPTFMSIVPSLVGPQNLRAAISLNSMQVNGSRVIGPAIGGYLTSQLGFGEVFAINAATYLIVIAALFVTMLPPSTSTARSFADRIFGGFKLAARSAQVGAPLLTMTVFSLFCLPFIGQMPAIAEINLGIEPKSSAYGLFYACFGLGALIGAGMVGTVLLNVSKVTVSRLALAGFAVALAGLAVVRSEWLGYPMIFVVGLFYFALPTALSTFLQEHLDEAVRGRAMALWVLSFGGTVPIANLIAGPIVEATSLTFVLGAGVVVALGLATVVRLREGPVADESLLLD